MRTSISRKVNFCYVQLFRSGLYITFFLATLQLQLRISRLVCLSQCGIYVIQIHLKRLQDFMMFGTQSELAIGYSFYLCIQGLKYLFTWTWNSGSVIKAIRWDFFKDCLFIPSVLNDFIFLRHGYTYFRKLCYTILDSPWRK